jgi:FMN phosphatase YigB (HAD superfamily)
MTMPVIVWDVDDVLNNLMFEWFNEFRHKHNLSVSYNDLRLNPPCDILGISLDDYLMSLDDFRRRKMLTLAPVQEVLEWFQNYGSGYRHIALTAVPFKFAPFSAQWVLNNFGEWIRAFYYVPSPRKTDNIAEYDKNKGEVLKKIGQVDLFIDDNEGNIAQAMELGIKSIVFARPWNMGRKKTVAECLKAI